MRSLYIDAGKYHRKAFLSESLRTCKPARWYQLLTPDEWFKICFLIGIAFFCLLLAFMPPLMPE